MNFGVRRHVGRFQSADTSAHSKFERRRLFDRWRAVNILSVEKGERAASRIADIISTDLVRDLRKHGRETQAEPNSFSTGPAESGYARLLRRREGTRSQS